MKISKVLTLDTAVAKVLLWNSTDTPLRIFLLDYRPCGCQGCNLSHLRLWIHNSSGDNPSGNQDISIHLGHLKASV